MISSQAIRPIAFLTLQLVLLLTLLSSPSLTFAQTPLQRIAFTRYKNPPKGWTKYDAANTTATNLRFVRNFKVPGYFRFSVRAKKLTYVFSAPAPGSYTLRLGIVEAASCDIGRRFTRYRVNGIYTEQFDVATLVGCGKLYYRDVNFEVGPDLKVEFYMQKCCKSRVPFISNLQLFADGEAPPLPSLPPSVSPSSAVAESVSPSVSPSQSSITIASPSASSSPDPSGSNVSLESPTPSPSSSPSASLLTSPSPSGSEVPSTPLPSASVLPSGTGSTSPTPSSTPSVTPSTSFVESSAPSESPSASVSTIATVSSSPSETVSPVPSAAPISPSPSASLSSSPTASASSPASLSASPSMDVSPSPSESVVSSSSPSESASPTASASAIGSPSPSSSASASPSSMAVSSSPTPSSRPDDIILNVGPSTFIEGTNPLIDSGGLPLDTSGVSNVPASAFLTSRQGNSFTTSFDLSPGTYTVTLGFIETNVTLCSTSARVFNVFINGLIRLEAYDIFTAAGGKCRTAVSEKFVGQAVDPLNPMPFTITFTAVSSSAIVSYIRVKKEKDDCDALGSDEISEDHLAHAVPGVYPSNGDSFYVDVHSQGYVNVQIDGSASHTHFVSGSITGSITSYKWVIPETGKVLSTNAIFSHDFPLGTTRLRLSVVDNSCSAHEAETSVTVTGNTVSGMYCYYYEGLLELPLGGTLLEFPRPSFSAVSSSLSLGFPNFSFRETSFVARCTFFLEFDKITETTDISVDTLGTGVARVYKGEDLIIDSTTSTSSGPMTTSIGLASFEMIYQRTDLIATPRLKLMVNGTVPSTVLYDRSQVMPIITQIDPPNGRIRGGSKTYIRGFGLFRPLIASFGNQNVTVRNAESNSKNAVVFPPAVSSAQVVEVKLTSNTGRSSGTLQYEYGTTCDPVEFDAQNMTESDGSNLELLQPTSATIWQDGKLYIGTRPGQVFAIEYEPVNMTVISSCYSEVMTDSRYDDRDGNPSVRSVLGITFHPGDTEPRPYIALSTLFWQRQGKIALDNTRAWSNGAIERLKPASAATLAADPNQCLEYDKNIVRFLPVADGDHSVNEIVFSQNGDLLIAVGGNTNAGLPYVNLGGNWGSYLSGSIVIAHTSRGSAFNGEIEYTTPDNLRTAVPVRDDVELYATGVRNLFAMAMGRSGKIFATDMGPNCGFGNVSSSCSEYNETEAALRSTTTKVPFPGSAIGGQGDCKYSAGRRDKLIEVKAGKFYGHSNLIRGTHLNDEGECVWIDPDTGLSPPPAQVGPRANYEHRLVMTRSASTGVLQYGANLFCGALRGDVLVSSFKGRRLWRVRTDNNNNVFGNPTVLSSKSGLRIVENEWGDLLFPNYRDPFTFVLRPRISSRVGVFAANAIPFRHARAGGTKLRIGGWGFIEGVTVTVGGQPCTVVQRTEGVVVCLVPAYAGAAESVDVVVTVGSTASVLAGGVLYMSV